MNNSPNVDQQLVDDKTYDRTLEDFFKAKTAIALLAVDSGDQYPRNVWESCVLRTTEKELSGTPPITSAASACAFVVTYQGYNPFTYPKLIKETDASNAWAVTFKVGSFFDEDIEQKKYMVIKSLRQESREFIPSSAINVLHSLVDIGEEIFKGARPRNELESKSINDFIRSKTKTISSKRL